MVKIDFSANLPKIRHKRVKTPTILQMDATECGAVSLAIILAYYGLHLSPERMRETCGVTRDGSKAINIIKAARNLGMEADGRRIDEVDDLFYIKTPFIIFWKFEHFLVVEGIVDKKVYINDPATGPRIISLEELDKYFTGVVLEISPSKDFQPRGKREKSTWGLLKDYIQGDELELSYIFLTTVLLSLPQAVFALLVEFFVDNILMKEQRQWMVGFTIILVILVCCNVLLLWIQRYYLILYKLRFLIEKIPKFFNQLLHLPMAFYMQRSTGDIANRIHIFDELSLKITNGFTEVLISFLSIAIYLGLISLINPIIGLITIFFTILNLSVITLTQRTVVDLGRRFSQDQAKVYSIEYSGLQLIESLKFMSGENRFFRRWLHFKSKLIVSQQQIDFYSAMASMFPRVLYYANLVILTALGSYLVLQGKMTAGGIMAIYTLLLLFPEPVGKIVDNLIKINELKGNLIRVNDVSLAYKDKNHAVIETDKVLVSNQLLDIKNLYFGYCKLEAPLLSEINISVQKGQMVALTGASGGGKSSLLNLICGLYEPWLGEIYLLGKKISQYHPRDLFKLVSYVDQNIFLFQGTLRDNLTMWDDSIDDESIYQALKVACVDDIIHLKGGLDYPILEGGSNISLGQAQRIELARALLKKPTLLLLDEATSALDSITEAKIYANLRALHCSYFIVAHRLSAIRHCNEIIVIENGTIIEHGQHQELIEQNGRYRQFIEKEYLS